MLKVNQQQGAILIEAAIALPILLLTFFGLFDFVLIQNEIISIQAAIEKSARTAVVTDDPLTQLNLILPDDLASTGYNIRTNSSNAKKDDSSESNIAYTSLSISDIDQNQYLDVHLILDISCISCTLINFGNPSFKYEKEFRYFTEFQS